MGHQGYLYTEESLCENTRQPSESQVERPQNEPNLLTPDLDLTVSRTMRK